MQCALEAKLLVVEVLRRPAELARDEDLRAGGLGCLCDVHLRGNSDHSNRGDDDVRAAKRGRECRYVGILGGSDADAARRERLDLLLVFGLLGECVRTFVS